MPWAKIDDGFTDHPKVMAAGPLAGWLFVCGVTYAARMLTDGFIPMTQVRKLADVDNATELADRLVAVGLWERCRDGYRIHDFLDYNPSAEKVKAERRAAAERMQRLRSPELRPNNERSSEEVQPPRPHPVPVSPVRIPTTEEDDAPTAPAAVKYTTEFEAFWSMYPRGHGAKAPSFVAWKKVPTAEREAVMRGLAAWKHCDRWKRGVIVSAEKWLREKRWSDDPPNENGKPLNGYYDDPNEVQLAKQVMAEQRERLAAKQAATAGGRTEATG